MKKPLLYLLLFAVAFSSCKKGSGPKPNPPGEGKTYDVTFNVGFTQEISSADGQKINSVGTNAITIPADVELLTYLVYGSSGSLVHRITQESTAPNFGSITDKLPAGTYTVILFAGKKNLALSGEYQVDGGFVTKNKVIPEWSDTFFKKTIVTVTDAPVSQNVAIERVVGKLTVKLLDVMPANATKLVINISKDYNNFRFRDAAPYGNVETHQVTAAIPTSAIGKANFSISTVLMVYASDITVTIQAFDSANQPIGGQSRATNVRIEKNTQTILSGYLFGATSDFNVGLNQAWDTPTDIQF